MHAAPTLGHQHSRIPRSGCARMRRAAVAAFRPTRRSGRLPLTLRRNPQSIACRMIMTARGLASPGRGAVVARPFLIMQDCALSQLPAIMVCMQACCSVQSYVHVHTSPPNEARPSPWASAHAFQSRMKTPPACRELPRGGCPTACIFRARSSASNRRDTGGRGAIGD